MDTEGHCEVIRGFALHAGWAPLTPALFKGQPYMAPSSEGGKGKKSSFCLLPSH